jgi:sec-independent protein translocase protein TatB
MASGAREQIKEEVGIDIDEVDWKKYDPRQYDPRRIIKDALLDDDAKPVSARGAPRGRRPLRPRSHESPTAPCEGDREALRRRSRPLRLLKPPKPNLLWALSALTI